MKFLTQLKKLKKILNYVFDQLTDLTAVDYPSEKKDLS